MPVAFTSTYIAITQATKKPTSVPVAAPREHQTVVLGIRNKLMNQLGKISLKKLMK